MRIVAAALLILLAAGLQGSPLNDLLTWQIDLLLVLVISWAVGTGPKGGLAMGFVAGTVQDVLLGGGFTYAILKALIGLMAGGIRPFLHDKQGMVVTPLIVVFSLLQDGAIAMTLGLQGFGLPWGQQMAIALPVAAGSALLGWPISLGIRTVLHRTRNPWALRESQS
jgi:rod shape-determining protein MreD